MKATLKILDISATGLHIYIIELDRKDGDAFNAFLGGGVDCVSSPCF